MRNVNSAVTLRRLKELLLYDKQSGVFSRKIARGQHKAGSIAGGLTSSNYVEITIDGISYRAHQLAWLYVTGEWAKTIIDHKNTIRTDNSWENLRPSNYSLNGQNRRSAQSNNKVGALGVCMRGKRFKAKIQIDKRTVHLGYFDTKELAEAAYINAKRELHPACTI